MRVTSGLGMQLRICGAIPLVAAVFLGAAPCVHAQDHEVSPVVVVGVTPLGSELDADKIAAPVKTADAKDIDRSHALDLSEFMTRNVGGIYVNDIQNNPLQPDLNYRGFTASPLLGTPQGLSVYVDGMRFNQPFGDVVSWDLLPRQAVDSIALIPGSNPLFGLNTLGGALSVRTKDGKTHPGGMVQLGYGSHNRRLGEAEVGGSIGAFDGYATVTGFNDDGWRDDSPSNAFQSFAKLRWASEATHIALSGAFARTDLNGNGLQEQRFLADNRGSVYTKPDNTKNQSGFGNLTYDHDAGGDLTFSGNAYFRDIRTRTYNGDVNDDSLTESVYQPNAVERAALTAASFTGFPTAGETAANTPFPKFRCIANALLNAEPGEKCNGLINRTHTRQHEGGFGAQANYRGDLGGMGNQLVAGFAYKQSRARFTQSSQFGYLTLARSVIPVNGPGAFADGTQASENAFDARVDLTGRNRKFSVFVSDTADVTDTVAVTVSASYDIDQVRNRDAITPGGGRGSLDGSTTFERLNPAVGVTWKASNALKAYASLTQGGRAPSVIELGCADPDNPCRLPNALAGDPPLNQVRTRTAELGARGTLAGATWSAGVFRVDNHDDILFVADDVSGFGYFKNFGRTRRDGVELSADGEWGPVAIGASYTYLRATYRTAEAVSGGGNSANDAGPGLDGDIVISPGDRIPMIPRHLFKAQLSWEVSEAIGLTADMLAASGVYARGNENNAHQPDGVFYLGPGRTKGYAVLNLGADWRPTKALKLFVQVKNVFDARYETAAQLGATGFTDTGAFVARPFGAVVINGERPIRNATFFAPGAPRMIWAGIRYSFGR